MSFLEQAVNDFRQHPLRSTAMYGTPAIAVPAAGYGIYQLRERRAPERIGNRIGSSANFDAATDLTPWQQRQIEDWDEEQVSRFQEAVNQSTTNAVRLGQMTPDEARRRSELASFNLNADDVTNVGQLQQGAMTAADLPNATSQLGNTYGLGLDNEYWSQLRNASALQGNLTEDMGDQMISREFDRTARYRLPLENYRMNRDFAYGQKAEQNTMRRGMATGLLNSYANTAQQLMTSGL
jgi:hypothetical protein